jgi:hypothetical protein
MAATKEQCGWLNTQKLLAANHRSSMEVPAFNARATCRVVA